MLKQLRVRNFALIDEATLQFDSGLNVLTGETGAGKSILIEALGFVLGNRLESEWLRPEKVLSVEAVFEISPNSRLGKTLADKGIRLEEEILNIKREAETAGKSRSFLNGVLIPTTQLREVSPLLVDIFGQRDGDSLYETKEHAVLLDQLAGTEEDVEEFAVLYERRQELIGNKKNLTEGLAQKERELDLLRYQINEIESAKPVPEEDIELQELKQRLNSVEKLATYFKEAYGHLYNGEPSALDLLGRTSRALTMLAKVDPSREVSELLKEVETLEIRTGEITRSLDKYGESLEAEPGRLEEVMERLELLDRLKKKYGKTLGEVSAFLQESKKRLEFLESSDENLKNFDKEIEALEKSMELKAKELTAKRKRTSEKTEKEVVRELESLEMKGSRFEIRIQASEFNRRGKDAVEFFLSANTGEELKPLAKVASGGEASRVQLALKKCFSKVQAVSTFIFDEIDSGIGARLAPVIGEKLEKIAEGRVLIAITHLAPVASRAACHWQVAKKSERGKTVVQFQKLEGQTRVQEIAKMLSGKNVTSTSLKHAEEILKS